MFKKPAQIHILDLIARYTGEITNGWNHKSMGRRSDHSREELHNLIVDAALNLIRESGASAVTARKIASSIGYTPGMLYAVFKNQQDIFLHVNLVTLEALQSQCESSGTDQHKPIERLQSLGCAYWSFAREHTHQFNLLFTRQTGENVTTPPAIPTRVQTLFGLVENALVELKPSSDAESVALAARALWSGVHGATELGLSDLFFFTSSANSNKTLSADDQALQVIHNVVNQFVAGWLTKGTT